MSEFAVASSSWRTLVCQWVVDGFIRFVSSALGRPSRYRAYPIATPDGARPLRSPVHRYQHRSRVSIAARTF